MDIGMARMIFNNIDSEKVSMVHKGEAIRDIIKMETKNSISKAEMLKVIEWLWNQVFIEESEAAHARWIQVTQTAAKCSRCGYTKFTNGADLTGKALVHKVLFPFCPYCGAKMDQEEEDGKDNN